MHLLGKIGPGTVTEMMLFVICVGKPGIFTLVLKFEVITRVTLVNRSLSLDL